MGDRSLPEVNRLCDARYRTYIAELHSKQKHEIRTTINNASPQTFAHLTSRRKRKQTQLGKAVMLNHVCMRGFDTNMFACI